MVVELVDNAFRKRYDVRLLDFHSQSAPLSADQPSLASTSIKNLGENLKIIDLRGRDPLESTQKLAQKLEATICDRCPHSWQDLNTIIAQASQSHQALALVYPNPEQINGAIAWQTLVGIAKYLSRTGKTITRSQLVAKLGIDDQNILQIGFEELQQYGYAVKVMYHELNHELNDSQISISSISTIDDSSSSSLTITQQFIQAANEFLFQQQFFDHQLRAIAMQ